jgi:transposase
MSKQRRSRIRLLAAERAELERRIATCASSPQAAYRAEIVLRAAAGQTDARIAEDLGLAERTVWMWRRRFALRRLAGLNNQHRRPTPRRYDGEILARLLVLARNQPADVYPLRTGQTHWTINDLAQYVAAHPELGLGRPSKSTIGLLLKRHGLRLNEAAPDDTNSVSASFDGTPRKD